MNPYIASMTEKALQEAIRQACAAWKLPYYHTHDSRHSPDGFPDTVIIAQHRLIIAELKREGNRPTAAQQRWLDAFAQVRTVETYCWCPRHLDDALTIIGG